MATPADLGGHMYNWLSRNGFPVRQYQTNMAPPEGFAAGSNSGWAQPGRVYLDPKVHVGLKGAAARLGKRGPIRRGEANALQVLMHEGLHQMRYGRSPDQFTDPDGKPGSQLWYEEGATEAATADLLPIFVRQMYGDRFGGHTNTAYPDQLQNVRQLSVFGSGAKKFKDYKARVWRRSFLHADPNGRQRMVEEAHANQARVAR
jgi:hypothetical protein